MAAGAPDSPGLNEPEAAAELARRQRAAELEAEIARLATDIHAASYRLIALLGDFEALDGWREWPTPAHWLQWRCGYSLGTAREKFRVARALPGLPAIRAAFERGALSFAQVRAMTRIATPENEAMVMAWAARCTAAQLEKLTALYRRYGESAGTMAQHAARSFSYREEEDGSVSFHVRLPPEQAAVVIRAVEAARASLESGAGVSAETHECDVSAETRRLPRADAFMRVVEAYFEPDRRPRSLAEKYQVHVHLDLRREAGGPVQDPDAPTLSEATLRRLGCEAGLVPVLYDGAELLSVGRRTRAIPPAIRRALRLRDRGCRFPGCTHTRHVDAHHVQHWADGGETKLANLVELCSWHHRLVHEGGYGLKVAADGALVFTRPDGARIPDMPPPFAWTGQSGQTPS